VNILALLTDGFGSVGGIARYNQQLMTAMHQCSVVSELSILPRFGQTTSALSAPVFQNAPAPRKLIWMGRAGLLAARQRFDLVFCGHLNAVPLAAIIAKLTRARLWVQVHGIEAWQERGSHIRMGLQAATVVTSVSRYTRNRLLEWSEIAPERVRVLPNTFGPEFGPRLRSDALSARYNLFGKRVILTVGRLDRSERYKGHDRVIQAMPDVLRQLPDAVYLIVGSGEDQPRLERLAQDCGVADFVLFVGQVPAAELPDYFALAHVFAMPSTGEGFGIAFLEAAASGLPVIGGNRDGSLDALADGTIGRAVDPDDLKALAHSIVAALTGQIAPNPAATARFAFTNFAAHVDGLIRQLQ
jgi:phosphatidyl-myo-inositol dimannoside synthase